jgi:archaeal chaperonin
MTDKPFVLMPEDVQRILGKDAQRNNIMAAKLVSDVVKTTLGPKGMDKMLVSPTGDIIVTNDGVTILNEMQVEHPAAKMIIEVAKTQEDEVGDGTTTAVMLAGRLLENAESLLDKKIHPTVITKGYRLAAERLQQILKEIAVSITPENDSALRQIAMTSMTGKGAENAKEKFADIIVKAVKQVQHLESKIIELSDIKLEKIKGGSIEDTDLVSGIVLDKERVSSEMPPQVSSARIALLDFPLEVKNPEIDTKVSISSPDQLQSFIDQEERFMKNMTEKLKSTGANVIFCQKGIDDSIQYLLSKDKIYACRRVSKSDIEKIAKATGGKIVSNLNELTNEELGSAQDVREVKHSSGDAMTYITGCSNPKALTILIHGGTEHVTDEIERAIKDGLGDVSSVLKYGFIVPGGGAIEIELSKRLREFSQSLSGREQLAVDEFASALEYIPTTLAENAGMDPIDVLTELKSKHDSGDLNAGLNLFTEKIENTLEAGILEPLKIKTQAISSAAEVAIMILRIDDVIASSGSGGGSIGGGMSPGMGGGMPPGMEY